MTELINKENLITTSELAKMLNTSNKVVLDIAKKYLPNKKIENGKTTYWNEKETSTIIKNIDYNNSQAKQPLLASKGEIKTQLMIKEEANNSLNNLKSLDIQEQIKASFLLQQNIIQQLNNENNELKDWKNEKLAIDNKEYKKRELRAKINRLIRLKSRDLFKNNYKDTWNHYFKLYGNIHCFVGTQNLQMIEDRGHLNEFYNLLLDN